jgi:hypothetical protein
MQIDVRGRHAIDVLRRWLTISNRRGSRLLVE